jgi:hypothetical protein
MKRLFLIALVALLALGSLATVVFANDEVLTCTTDPEDGSGLPECGTRADNECYEGGTMAGKCDNEWLWKAGWEIARFNDGLMTREQVNPEWAFLLPPPLPPEVWTICSKEDDEIICLSKDQTGTIDDGTDGTIDALLYFVDDVMDCPRTFRGYIVIDVLLRGDLVRRGFSRADLTYLGLKAYGCGYVPPRS